MCARTGLWEPGAGNRPGPPGQVRCRYRGQSPILERNDGRTGLRTIFQASAVGPRQPSAPAHHSSLCIHQFPASRPRRPERNARDDIDPAIFDNRIPRGLRPDHPTGSARLLRADTFASPRPRVSVRNPKRDVIPAPANAGEAGTPSVLQGMWNAAFTAKKRQRRTKP